LPSISPLLNISKVVQFIEITLFLMKYVLYCPDGVMEYWNVGDPAFNGVDLKGIYLFYTLLVKR